MKRYGAVTADNDRLASIRPYVTLRMLFPFRVLF